MSRPSKPKSVEHKKLLAYVKRAVNSGATKIILEDDRGGSGTWIVTTVKETAEWYRPYWLPEQRQ